MIIIKIIFAKKQDFLLIQEWKVEKILNIRKILNLKKPDVNKKYA